MSACEAGVEAAVRSGLTAVTAGWVVDGGHSMPPIVPSMAPSGETEAVGLCNDLPRMRIAVVKNS